MKDEIIKKLKLSGADLSKANLSKLDLSKANLRQADLSGVNLSKANLRQADLFGVNLYGANLREADLSGVNLYGAAGIFSFGPMPTSQRIVYAVKHQSGWMIQAGCFWGNTFELEERVKQSHNCPIYNALVSVLKIWT